MPPPDRVPLPKRAAFAGGGRPGARERNSSASSESNLLHLQQQQRPRSSSAAATGVSDGRKEETVRGCENSTTRFPPPFPDLYEGLKLVQRGRLDDQRGTEINFEMPDFLKRGRTQVFIVGWRIEPNA